MYYLPGSFQPMSMSLPRALRPFETRQYRLLVLALVMSLFGSGIWAVAMVWQVMELGGGPRQLSSVATAGALGLMAAVLLGGVTADRVPQRRVLMTVEAIKCAVVGAGAAAALSGHLQLSHMIAIALVMGLADAFFYPAYTAMLPAILPPEQLLAANGVEGVLRPTIQQAAGPALAGLAIAVLSPAHAMALVAGLQLLAVLGLTRLRPVALRRELAPGEGALKGTLGDIRDGFKYMVATPWLLATLLMATLMILLIMGPIQVLLPFAIRERMGGDAGAFALALAAFGVGGALGSLAIASWRMPRRYLTTMLALWGVSCVPLAVIGFATTLWLVVPALFLAGVLGSMANVIWGTLLQRRVPPALLGRVSSLDFFVSLALMPVSMAIAGPVGERFGLPLVFSVAGFVPPLLAVLALTLFRLRRDELAHPLDAAQA